MKIRLSVLAIIASSIVSCSEEASINKRTTVTAQGGSNELAGENSGALVGDGNRADEAHKQFVKECKDAAAIGRRVCLRARLTRRDELACNWAYVEELNKCEGKPLGDIENCNRLLNGIAVKAQLLDDYCVKQPNGSYAGRSGQQSPDPQFTNLDDFCAEMFLSLNFYRETHLVYCKAGIPPLKQAPPGQQQRR